MLKKRERQLLTVTAYFALLCVFVLTQNIQAQTSKPPIIVIPGLTGSNLVNEKTGEVVWFKATRSKDDDVRLPLSPDLAENRDNLVARDAARKKLVGLRYKDGYYASLVKALENRGGYRETSWEMPRGEGAIYVFAYDWRRDNVENARLLIQKIEKVKRQLQQPDLKFNVVAHSMGGIIARYAAMYGDADLPGGDPRPDWAGAQHFNQIFLLGTPSEGSLLSLNALVNGFALFGLNINLPFVQNLTRFDFFTVPSIFQLLPYEGTFRAFDENLQPITVDLYDSQTWDKYGWHPVSDPRFAAQFNAADRRNARAYFSAALSRAKQLSRALSDENSANAPVKIFLIGGNCADTLDAVVIRRSGKNWTALFKATAFRTGGGKRVTANELKRVIFAPGDGVVSKRSLLTDSDDDSLTKNQFFQCENHNLLVENVAIQNNILRQMRENRVN